MQRTADTTLPAGPGPKPGWTLLYHTILIGASALIPFPFVDDVLVAFFQRRLVSQLARNQGLRLTPLQVRQLARQDALSCSTGCLFLISYPIKELVETFLPWIKWQRAMEEAASAYYSGYLWTLLFAGTGFDAAHSLRYGRAVEEARKRTNTGLVKRALKTAFLSSRALVRDLARGLGQLWLYSFKSSARLVWRIARAVLSRLPLVRRLVPAPDDDRLDQLLEEQQPQIKQIAGELARHLSDELNALPAGTFDGLRERLQAALAAQGLAL